jgi:hypothetical protein
LVEATIAREFARRARLVPTTDLLNGAVPGGHVFLQLANQDGKPEWPGNTYLIVELNASVVEAITYTLQLASFPLAQEAFLTSNFSSPGPPSLFCADHRTSILATDAPDYPTAPGYLVLDVTSGQPLDVMHPQSLPLSAQVSGIESLIYRSTTVIHEMTVTAPTSFKPADAREICETAERIQEWGNEYLSCGSQSASSEALLALQDYLVVPELQSIFFGLSYITAAIDLLSSQQK